MIAVIIAGGSGTRLWPLSTPNYPKHLLKINDDNKSLLQNTYERAKNISRLIYVVTEIGHLHHIKEQLPELADDQFIIEPARRGTANCVAAALALLAGKIDENEAIAFLAADHFIRDSAGFTHSFKVAKEASEKDGRIVLVGVEPYFPSTGFGYIEKGDLHNEKTFVFNVKSFKEKPEFEVARRYLKSGKYLWNCSYFVGSIKTFKKNMEQYSPEMFTSFQSLLKIGSPEEYKQTYLGFENNAIDYALIENVKGLLVVPASFDWMDLGTYGDLHKVVVSDQAGNYLKGNRIEIEKVENSFIQNYDDKPVVVIGLDNIVIVNTQDGLLVVRKDLAQKVGDVIKRALGKEQSS